MFRPIDFPISKGHNPATVSLQSRSLKNSSTFRTPCLSSDGLEELKANPVEFLILAQIRLDAAFSACSPPLDMVSPTENVNASNAIAQLTPYLTFTPAPDLRVLEVASQRIVGG